MRQEKNRIGLIVDGINSNWSQRVWPSFIKSALKVNKSLFIFPGGTLYSRNNSDYLRNAVYSLANTENLDGLICWSASIQSNESIDRFEQFHSGFDPLPYVTMSCKIPGRPCVEFDGYAGMKQLVTHCIKVHGAKKIAFLRGPASHSHVLERLRGYEDALMEAGLPVVADNPLVTDPFDWHDGDAAAAQLFEERKLTPGRDFDTLIGADDGMTFNAVNYFSRRGYFVPRDYHALGFDNSTESLLCDCPLSTIEVPYSEMSNESFRILLKLMERRDAGDFGPIEDVFLPSRPVIRESCGCDGVYYKFDDQESSLAVSGQDSEPLIARIAEYLDLSPKEAKVFVTPLIRAWHGISHEKDQDVLASPSSVAFFRHFEKTVLKYLNSKGNPELIFRLLKDIYFSGLVLKSQFRKFEPALLRTIFKVRERSAVYSRYKRTDLNQKLTSLQFELLAARDRKSLIEILARHMPGIGINTAGLVLYNDEKTSLWVGSFAPNGISPVHEQTFPAKLLVPESLRHLFLQGIFMVQPLFIEERSLGYIIHTVPDCNGPMYEEIRSTVSYAIKSLSQFEEIVKAQQKMLESMEQSRILEHQKELAQAASEAKSQFLANVSHEIRTPMNAVLGMSELMLSEKLNGRQRQYMEDIKTSAMTLLEIINEVLDLSKIQSGKMTLVPEHYDFKTLIDNICSMMRFLIKDENVAFDLNINGDMPKYLYGDDVRLRQILLNILSNAMKFTKAGFVRLSIEVTESEIHFAVRDTGAGIRNKDIPYLFEAFKQLDTPGSRNNKGTGLGLTITKALVEMMNGKIMVESVFGEGTTFHIIIPKVLGDESQIHNAGSGRSIICSSDTKILVVDDNVINLHVITGLLQLSNITVSTADSGRQAIEMLTHNKYDLIFMDHMMPEMDGIEAMKIIRGMGIDVPIIALTANAVTSAKEMLLAAGMTDFLSKPIVKNELNEILGKWIHGAKFIDSSNEIPYEYEFSDFWKKIDEIDGISCRIGFSRVSGQSEVYKNALKLLIKEIEKCSGNLVNFLSVNDMNNFAIEVHSMKSSLANVGAMELSAKAHELETASARKDADFCASHLQPFLDGLRVIGKGLSEAFSDAPQDEDLLIVPPELASILTRMENFIVEMKYVEINNELKNLEILKAEGRLKDEIEEIKDAILVMDYDNVLVKIQKLKLL